MNVNKTIIKSLEIVAYILFVFIVLGAAFAGGASSGFGGFLLGLIGGFIVAITILGVLFLLIDIADNSRRTAELLAAQSQLRDSAGE